ncbi:MAG: indolepyruvate ferredoxin oxidoreductase subunit alpha [Clostridia bacterium]|nr:indolepyruvate ferredoxin oxidoreductase subunit alpha [Clostridia bacterium]MBQ4447588.1 indolepyruvate ferredoxin oxidoreductase subunit alpha [Clostridia bacterium]
MLGNEAIARGAYEAGVRVSSAYPGTPSTEINENIANYREIYSEWAPNEKVAVEVALGAAVGGARSMACMKHVGLNVAADPFFTATYTGINAGMVVVVADDPGMHSSQNEQDTRLLARASHAPCLDPSSSQECKDFMKLAFEISEEYDTPVIVRLTTRIAHARTLVEQGERVVPELREYKKDIKKYVSMPANMIGRHKVVEAREIRLAEDANTLPINRIEWADRKIGVITSGAAYNYVKEAMPEASVLKLGLAYPLPRKLIEEFAAGVETLYVIEDMEPFYEDTIKAWGIPCSGKDKTGVQGELFMHKIEEKFNGAEPVGPMNTADIPVRPPVLCPGCPHRGLYYVLGKLKLTVCSDIGCYTLGALPPLSGVDTCVCMGASIGMAHGMEKARGVDQAKHTVAVLGDSTFCHSGMTGLLNMAYNRSVGTVIIADNSITGMTGHQNNPANGKDIHGEPTTQLDIVKLCEAMGVASVRIVDPFDLKETERVIKEEVARDGLSVVISRRPCALIIKQTNKPVVNDPDACVGCGMCMKVGCPAIIKTETGVRIDPTQCVGCGMCTQLCHFGALKSAE